MSKKHHLTTLDHLYSHPINLNIEWKRVESLLKSVGAHLEETHHGRVKVLLRNHTTSFAKPHGKTINDKNEVVSIRHFLEEAGVTPDNFDAGE